MRRGRLRGPFGKSRDASSRRTVAPCSWMKSAKSRFPHKSSCCAYCRHRGLSGSEARRPLTVDVRIIAATNRNLLEEVKEGQFREDLYYRLNVIPLQLPPLAKRRNDVPLLAEHFLRRFALVHRKTIDSFSPETMRVLLDHPWPGNVRELENTIEHAVVLSKGPRIETSHLPAALRTANASPPPADRSSTIVQHERKTVAGNHGRVRLEQKEGRAAPGHQPQHAL